MNIARIFLLGLSLLPAFSSWDRIDILCVVRDAAGRRVTNLRPGQLHAFDAAEPRPILAIARDTSPPDIVRVDRPESLYQEVYLAIMRRFSEDSRRRILVIAGGRSDAVTEVLRWELALLALRQHVVIYGTGESSATVAWLAEETGGRIASWPDIQSDLDAQYRLVISPHPLGTGVGRFHPLELRGPNGWTVQAPRDYNLAPPW